MHFRMTFVSFKFIWFIMEIPRVFVNYSIFEITFSENKCYVDPIEYILNRKFSLTHICCYYLKTFQLPYGCVYGSLKPNILKLVCNIRENIILITYSCIKMICKGFSTFKKKIKGNRIYIKLIFVIPCID